MDLQSLAAEPKSQRGLLSSISIVVLLSNSSYALVAPVLPFIFEEKGISDLWAGFIFA